MAFTSAQQAAIVEDSHLLIVAGPGSGKTTTTVAKAKRILSDPSRRLVMVTFTKEGAEEMHRRLSDQFEKSGQAMPPTSRLVVSTFHSIAIRHLFLHQPKRPVLSPQQQGLMLRDAIISAGISKELHQEVMHEFEAYMYAADRSAVDLSPPARSLISKYMARLNATGQMDLYAVSRECALKVNDGSIPPLSYTDMLVDEGQDTDDIQRMWIFAHARAGINVTIVGDDDQSIYEWRHALGYQGMKDFLDTFNARRIELGDNFRCRSEILSHAATLIALNRARLGKNLVARRGAGGSIFAVRSANPSAECESLAGLIAATPEKHRNAVVLARKNRSLDMLEMELRSRAISYKRLGASIWDDALIVGYLGFLQTLLDGSTVGMLAMAMHRGISDDVRAQLMRSMGGHGPSFLDGHVPELPGASDSEMTQLKKLSKDCAYWRRQLRGGQLGASVNEVILEVGEVFAGFTRNNGKQALVEMCARILSDMKGTLSNRLRTVSTRNRDISSSALILMTMHGSKGLEFETVHILDARQSQDLAQLLNPEPERRLMYVALTRAKARCVVWFSGEPHFAIQEAHLPVKLIAADVQREFEKGA